MDWTTRYVRNSYFNFLRVKEGGRGKYRETYRLVITTLGSGPTWLLLLYGRCRHKYFVKVASTSRLSASTENIVKRITHGSISNLQLFCIIGWNAVPLHAVKRTTGSTSSLFTLYCYFYLSVLLWELADSCHVCILERLWLLTLVTYLTTKCLSTST